MADLMKFMNKDYSELTTVEGTYNHALNIVNNTDEGRGLAALYSERGTRQIIWDLDDSNLRVIGKCLMPDQSLILFMYDNSSQKRHVIKRVWENGRHETIIRSTCINFQIDKPIDCKLYVKNGCDYVLYFTDNYNPYRSININRLEQYLKPGTTVQSANGVDDWACHKFDHFRTFQHPNFTNVSSKRGGGSLYYGAYTFAVRYVTQSGDVTNFSFFTNPVIVGNEVTAQNYEGYRGDLNDEADITKQEPRSIDVEIEDLDSSFEYYQIAVVEYTANTSRPTNFYILERRQIPSTGIDVYTYRGFDRTLHQSTSQTELTIPKLSIGRVKTHEVHDETLFVANVQERSYDWAKFQQAACKIKGEWQANNYDAMDLEIGGQKSDFYYYNIKSYTRGEVYSFAAVFLMKDGTYSPAFHIPGRAADNADVLANIAAGNSQDHPRTDASGLWDKQLVTVVSGTPTTNQVHQNDVQHLNLSVGDTIERWKVWNTAITTESEINLRKTKGHFGYYECENFTYQDFKDRNGDFVYGEDAWGNALANTPVRHWQFPDAMVDQHEHTMMTESAGEITEVSLIQSRPIGILFDNINIPSEYVNDVERVIIVRDEKTPQNSTVVDKGYMKGMSKSATEDIYTPTQNLGSIGSESTNMCQYISVGNTFGQYNSDASLFVKQAAECDYFEYSGFYEVKNNGFQPNVFFLKRNIQPFNYISIRGNYASHDSTMLASGSETEFSQYVPATGNTIVRRFRNFCVVNDINLTNLKNFNVSVMNGYFYMTAKNIKPDVNGDLFSISYIPCGDSLAENFNGVTYGGDTFINNMPFSQLPKSAGVSYQEAIQTVVQDESKYMSQAFPTIFLEQGSALGLMMVENKHNLAMHCYRQGDDEYLQVSPVLTPAQPDSGASSPDWRNLKHPIKIRPTQYFDANDKRVYLVQPQFRLLNRDYRAENTILKFFPLEFNYNWSSECTAERSHEIFYSERSGAQDKVDGFKVVRPLNVKTVGAHSGKINALYETNNRLYLHTDSSMFVLMTRPQELQASETIVYTGTGARFSVPPVEMAKTEHGYAGVLTQFGTLSTPFGQVVVDNVRGKVFLFGGGKTGMTEISTNGMHRWFRKHLPFDILNQIGIEHGDLANTTSKNGFGMTMIYDDNLRRIIIHKKDYKVKLNGYQFGGERSSVTTNPLVYFTRIDGHLRWYRANTEIFVEDSTHFTSTSWTISYSLDFQKWVSFHSYQPSLLFSTSNTLYSAIHDVDFIHAHDSDEYCNFYGHQFPCEVDITKSPGGQTSVYSHIELVARGEQVDEFGDITTKRLTNFTRIWVRTHRQSTGWVTLNVINGQNNNYPGQKILNNLPSVAEAEFFEAEYLYRINKLNDIIVSYNNEPVAISNPETVLAANPLQVNGFQGFVDVVPNVNIHDNTKNIFQIERFRDKFVKLRLEFTPSNQTRLALDFINFHKTPAIR